MDNMSEAEEIITDGSDAEMVEIAKMQLEEAKETISTSLKRKFVLCLIPKDPDDAKNVVVEVTCRKQVEMKQVFLRAIYTECILNIAVIKAGEVDVVSQSDGTSGGFKEVIFEVSGEDVYGTLKFEAGVHRVQTCASNRDSRSCAYKCSNCYGFT